MGLLSRIFGICRTKPPFAPDCWKYLNGRVELDLAKAPELMESGRAVRLEGRGLPMRVLVFRGNDGSFHALQNRCTHMGRRLDLIDGKDVLECCSVNKSRFNHEGEALSGPGSKPIKKLHVEKKGKRLTVILDRTDT